MTIAISVDLRPSLGPVRDQGMRPTCIAFATSDVHAVAQGQATYLSVEHLYYHAVQRSAVNDPTAGVGIGPITLAMELDGQAAEAGWPYLSVLPANLSEWVPPPSAAPVFRKPAVIKPGDPQALYPLLDGGQPAVLTVTITEMFNYGGQDGVIRKLKHDPETGRHAVVAVGYGEEAGERFILIRNSWGADWALAGHAWISEAYLKDHLFRIFTVK